ncbi:MAG TPA: hypothetical protein ENK18_04295 [Deltaproteobacteria bacterium]|nr:hypothetical protein [Deltaproteobacteria bacterium]
MLLGEYAVLDGAPALVAAVDRGVACVVTDAPGRQIVTPGDDRFVAAALAEIEAPPGRYAFSDWRPVPSDTKVGLGGSSAATVAAVVAGLARRGGRAPDPDHTYAIAREVHHRVQGSGSGVDVAASAYGGICRVERGLVHPLSAPALPEPVVVFSGASAATGPRVQRYLSHLPHRDRARFVDASRALVEAFPRAPAQTLDAAGRLLASMAEAAQIAYWTDAIDVLVTLARAHGGGAKPSGAGGGDIVVALFSSDRARSAYIEAVEDRGFLCVPISISPGAALISAD